MRLVHEPANELPNKGYRPLRWLQLCILGAVIGLVTGASVAMSSDPGNIAPYEYSLWRWQGETMPGALARLVGFDFRPSQEASDEEILQQYFSYTTELRNEVNREEPDLQRLAEIRSGRASYELQVEHIIRNHVTEAIETAGVQERLPFFNDVALTWPPVEFRLTRPPHVLVISPRDQIMRMSVHLLRHDLTVSQITEIEQQYEQRGDVVAHVVSIGGMAAYPAMVRSDRNYWSIVETAAHEWVHHYLAFYPLGQKWDTRHAITLNETVATIAGRAIAEIVHEQYPMEFPAGSDGSWLTRPEAEINYHEEMMQLRMTVDELLGQGHVEEAERVMEATRLYLLEHGVRIRKIDQAYFAFRGAYAASPSATDPIGPKVERVWELSGDVETFLVRMRDITSVAELDALLRRLEAIQEA